MISKKDRGWWDTLTVPWDIANIWPDSQDGVSEFLMDAFEEMFGTQPVDVEYISFQDGIFADILIDEEDKHPCNHWATVITAKLRHAGVNISIVVQKNYPYVQPKPKREIRPPRPNNGSDLTLDPSKTTVLWGQAIGHIRLRGCLNGCLVHIKANVQ